MANDIAKNGLIMHLLLSLKQGADQFPNIQFVKDTKWEDIQPDNAKFGRGLFRKVDQTAYVTAQENLKLAAANDLNNDARVLTRSVERLTLASDGGSPWDGAGPHPREEQLTDWVTRLVG